MGKLLNLLSGQTSDKCISMLINFLWCTLDTITWNSTISLYCDNNNNNSLCNIYFLPSGHSHSGMLMRHLAAEPRSIAELLLLLSGRLERSCRLRIRWCGTGGFQEHGQCFFIGLSCSIIIIIIKKDWQCKAGRGRLSPYQSEDPSPTLPTCRGKE